jgi:hypothetical protein
MRQHKEEGHATEAAAEPTSWNPLKPYGDHRHSHNGDNDNNDG